jgi:CheY-like chemotaxis protein
MDERAPGGVLVVDDDEDIREIIVELLEDHGFRATGAHNGRDALHRLREDGVRPRVILLDLMMPVMDGRTFRSEQRRDPALAAIPVVVLSARLDIFGLLEEMGVSRVLKKPINIEQLLRVVEEHW